MPVVLTFSFILSPPFNHFNLFYTVFTNGYDRRRGYFYSDCPKDAVYFVIKDRYTILGEKAFWNCVSLKTIKLPKSIKTINRYAFFNCLSLETIVLPPSLMTLGDRAFVNCSLLQTIVLPPSLTTLGDYAFVNCSSLQNIDLPPSITTMGDNVFGKGKY